MSSMLDQAIIDATALKEAALKNAENAIVEKYSSEVKQTLDKLLEQDAPLAMDPLGMDAGPEPMDDPAPDTPLAALDGDKACPCPDEDEQIELDIDLSALSKAAADLTTSDMGSAEDQEAVLQQVAESEDFEISDDVIVELLSEDESEEQEIDDSEVIEEEEEELLDEDEELEYSFEDELVDKIYEKLTVDLKPALSGWAGRPAEHIEAEMERELARRRDDEVEEDVKALKKAVEELMEENNSLKDQNEKFSSAVVALKDKLDEVNLSNARLLYTNRILSSASLNERQKSKIVEAISNAGSVEEAKVLCETLQSTVGSTKEKRTPKSLSEAIARPSAIIRGSRKEEPSDDPLSERLKRLAGIK
tara:strand:+ start:3410 stop:4498 length:1089 start_codon:yes stop_codon:yes gene_type:complete